MSIKFLFVAVAFIFYDFAVFYDNQSGSGKPGCDFFFNQLVYFFKFFRRETRFFRFFCFRQNCVLGFSFRRGFFSDFCKRC